MKLPFKTPKFNQNQKIWRIFGTGSLSFYVAGRYRGRGRWIKTWINFNEKSKPLPDWKSMDVDKAFTERHGITDYGSPVFYFKDG